MKPTRLFMADSAAGGAAITAPVTNLIPTKTPAGGAAGDPGAGGSGDSAAGAGSAGAVSKWDPAAALPEDRPDVFKNYKTHGDVDKAHRNALKMATEATAKVKELEGKQAQALDPDQFNQWLADIYETNEVSEDAARGVAAAYNLTPDMAGRFLNFLGVQRQEFVSKANAVLGGVVNYGAIEKWLQSGESGFSNEALTGFMELSGKGDVSWLTGVKVAFDASGNNAAASRDQSVKTTPPPSHRGRPVDNANHPGFKSREEYRTALRAAKATQNSAEIEKVNAKMQETPAHIVNSWPPG